MIYPKFDGLAVSSKLFICGLPIRLDSYKTCSFGCEYCFSNCRKIMEFQKEFQVCDVRKVARIIEQSLNGRGQTLLHRLIRNGITWHCGGMSDPFQPAEEELGITRQLVELTAQYGIKILFSTKSHTTYGCPTTPDLHSFQLSVTNVTNNDIEPNVESIEKRYAFYRRLKDNGYRVGIRIQPFLPNISSSDIVDMFHDADNFTIEGIKLVPQNEEMKKDLCERLNIPLSYFTQMGLLALKPQIRLKLYEPMIAELKARNIPYSISDNDLRKFGTNKCCCGDRLIGKCSTMNPTFLIQRDGLIRKESIMKEANEMGIADAECYNLFTSNRTGGMKTVSQIINYRYCDRSCTFSNDYQYQRDNELTLF